MLSLPSRLEKMMPLITGISVWLLGTVSGQDPELRVAVMELSLLWISFVSRTLHQHQYKVLVWSSSSFSWEYDEMCGLIWEFCPLFQLNTCRPVPLTSFNMFRMIDVSRPCKATQAVLIRSVCFIFSINCSDFSKFVSITRLSKLLLIM